MHVRQDPPDPLWAEVPWLAFHLDLHVCETHVQLNGAELLWHSRKKLVCQSQPKATNKLRALAHMGLGPYGPGPLWALAHMGLLPLEWQILPLAKWQILPLGQMTRNYLRYPFFATNS